MKFTQRKIAEQLLVDIEVISNHIRNLNDMTNFLLHKAAFISPLSPNAGNLHAVLIERELDAWRKLFMWSLTLTDKEQARIKAAAHDRFFKRDMYISTYLSDQPEDGWLNADEEEFRKFARRVFSEPGKEGCND